MRRILTILALLGLVAIGFAAYHGNLRRLQLAVATPTPSLQATEIALNLPKPQDSVSSPLLLEGYAKANWFPEGKAEVSILDANGEKLGTGLIYSEAEVSNSMRFTGTIEFSKPSTTTGNLSFTRPGSASTVFIPITFSDGQN